MSVVARNLAAAVISVSGALGGCASNPFKPDTTETYFTIQSYEGDASASLPSKKTYVSVDACKLDGYSLARLELGDRFDDAVRSARQAAALKQPPPVSVKQVCYDANEWQEQILVGLKPKTLSR